MTGSYGVDHAQGNYTCMRCGTLLGFMSNECPNCRQNELLEEANELRRKELEFQQEREREISYRKYQIEKQIERMARKYEYESLHGEGSFEILEQMERAQRAQAWEKERKKDRLNAIIGFFITVLLGYLFHIFPWSIYSIILLVLTGSSLFATLIFWAGS